MPSSGQKTLFRLVRRTRLESIATSTSSVSRGIRRSARVCGCAAGGAEAARVLAGGDGAARPALRGGRKFPRQRPRVALEWASIAPLRDVDVAAGPPARPLRRSGLRKRKKAFPRRDDEGAGHSL